jgi:glucose-1-phosphate adenylyltransferase
LVLLDSENYLVDIVEKPSTDTIDSFKDRFGKFRVSMNIFKLIGKEIYPFLKDCPIHPKRDEKELPTAVLNMCNSIPRAMKGFLLSEHVPDLTSKEDISILKTYIQEHYKT